MNSFDEIQLWLLFVVTVGFILVAVEGGFRWGVHRAARSEVERQAPIDAMVGSTLGLLAFVLAFTFGMATSRYDARKQLVLDDAISIRTADLRAQLLPEPHRAEIRQLLLEYVDVRVKAANDPNELPRALARTIELQDQLWSRTAALGQDAAAAPFAGALTQALIQMFDLHSKRISTAVHNRIPTTIWIALYSIAGLAMAMAGYRAGIAGRHSMVVTLTVVLAFSIIIILIADLDRPQEGFLKVEQQAMLDLQKRVHQRR